MAKVNFYYYQSSPRIHVSHLQEMSIIPMIGDTILLINDEFYALNKKIKDKNFMIEFKVIKREFRMISKKYHCSDINLTLEPTDIKY